jgi:biopolymer transport protein ExbB
VNRIYWGVAWLVLLTVPGWSSPAAQEAPGSLEELLERVRAERQADSQLHGEREARFVAERDQQQERIRQARTDLNEVRRQGEEKRAIFEQNEDRLEELRTQLDERAASLGELFGVVRQVARDTAGLLENSLVSVQLGERAAFLYAVGESRELPSLDELERLWIALLEEMTQSGRVVQFPTTVVDANGTQAERTVVRVGVFNSVSQGNYLRYVPETRQLVELTRQPEQRYRSAAQELELATDTYSAFGIDPSRGAILAALVQTPDLWERLQQGGFIGYIILALGFVGLALVVERAVYLWREGQRINAQRQTDTPQADNALGRVMLVYHNDEEQDAETLEARLDEAILNQVPRLERGLSTISILAAVAPLLGLLGTVVGMIDTFQSITLFGTGDPRTMSSGISQALVTTQLGLSVAIPIVLLHTLVSGKSTRLIQILDEQSAGMIARLVERRSELPDPESA